MKCIEYIDEGERELEDKYYEGTVNEIHDWDLRWYFGHVDWRDV